MTPDNFEKSVISLQNYFGVVGTMGGNPAVSTYFGEYCEILKKYIPFERRGLWCNSPRGKGKLMRDTFNPRYSNLNCHLDKEAYAEFKRDWPESMPFGHDRDSRHAPVLVAMKDVIADEGRRWELISNCDINRGWSAGIIQFRGQARAFFCEIAASFAGLYQHDPSYPDLGYPVDFVNGHGQKWWQLGMHSFTDQVRQACHSCGVPLRGHGELSQSADGVEQVSATHQSIYQPKRKGRRVELVTVESQLGERLGNVVRYLQNGA